MKRALKKLSTLSVMFVLTVLVSGETFSQSNEPQSETVLTGCWEKNIHFLGFKSLQYHFSPTKFDSYYQLNSVFTFFAQQPDKRSTLAKVEDNHIFIYKFNSMALDQQNFFSIKNDTLMFKDKGQHILLTMHRCLD